MVEHKPSIFHKTWDTATVPAHERFEYYREGVCQAFMSYTPKRPFDGNIHARLDLAATPGGSILRTKCTSVSLRRTRSDLASLKEQYVTFGLVMSGHMRAGVAGHASERSAGKSRLIDSTRLETVDIRGNFQHVTLIFDRDKFSDHIRLIDSFDSVVSLGGILENLTSYIEGRVGYADGDELSNLVSAANTLIISGLIKEKGYVEYICNNDRSTKSGIMESTKEIISRELSDGQLNAAGLAARFGLSSRFFQKMFQDEGTTLTRYVLNLRLDKIKADLENRALANMSPTALAFKWGFRDVSTFHRNFRRRFGDTPAQCRKRQSGE